MPNFCKKIISVASTILLAASLVLCIVVLVQVTAQGYASICGFSVLRVVTGSMEPAIPTGSLLVSQEISIDEIQVDDIVCFTSKESYLNEAIVTHRVISVLARTTGETVLETKGDANSSADGYFVDADNLVGIVVWQSGESSVMAVAVEVLNTDTGLLACVILPVLLVSIFVLRDSMRSIRVQLAELNKAIAQDAAQKAEQILAQEAQQTLAQPAQAAQTAQTTPPAPSGADGVATASQTDALLATFTPEEYAAMKQAIKEELMKEVSAVGQTRGRQHGEDQ